ncbi:DinB family protein [Ochrovirga pacifica]|uniref:DinB family protein n=1 Tax=Ochrovirga pacifica TaxID=1042376 RepID=UPI0002558B01|nr:DinB family protein [Ochrovirga pacifica]
MIDAIVQNLEKGKYLLKNLCNDQYSYNQIPPYHSSIGAHMRHVLDVFQCVFKGLDNSQVDFTYRERNVTREKCTIQGTAYFDDIIHQLKSLKKEDYSRNLIVIDNLGSGKISYSTTLAALLAQAQSHAIHHYATVGFLMNQQNIQLPNNCFGVNPTTPQK